MSEESIIVLISHHHILLELTYMVIVKCFNHWMYGRIQMILILCPLYVISIVHALMAYSSAWNNAVYCQRLKLSPTLVPHPCTPAPVPSYDLEPSVYQTIPTSVGQEPAFPFT
jgi:hypothetical protein